MKLLIKARSQAGARPRRGAPCPKCGHSELHHHEDRLKRSMWVGPCRSCGPFQKGRCEGAQFKVEEIAKSQPKDDKDRPEYGKVYSLTGPRSIASGDTWQGSEVWCGGTQSDHSAYGCRAKADHEHVGPNHIYHMRGAAKINGCTPQRCGLKARKSWSQVGGSEHRHDESEGSHRHSGGATPHDHPVGACGSKSCTLPDAPHSDDEPNWRTSKPQVYVDGWRGRAHRALRFDGKCVNCGRRTYSFDDGENDPRGILGRHASSAESAEDHGYPRGLKDVSACFDCMNDHDSYDGVMHIAHRQWGKQVGSGKSVPDKLPKDIADMDKSAAYNPFRARVRKINVGEPAIGGKVRPVRTQGVKWDDMRDRGKTKDTGDFSYEPKVTGKRTWQKSEPTDPTEVRPVGKTPWKWARERTGRIEHTTGKWATSNYKKERTNPAAVAQIKEARANMGDLTKSTGADCRFHEDDSGKWSYRMQRWPYGETPDYDTYGPFRSHEDAISHMDSHHANPGGWSVDDRAGRAWRKQVEVHNAGHSRHPFTAHTCEKPDCVAAKQAVQAVQAARMEKARKPDQYPPAYPDGFVTEVGRDTRICKSCGMPSGDHAVGCKGGGTEKVSDQVVKKAGVVFGTRPFARRALPKGQLSRERAGAPRYRKSLDCVCGDELGSHIGDGGCGSCDCAAFRKAQPVFVLRMRKAWQPDGRGCEEGACKKVATQSTAMGTLNCDAHAMANNAYARLTPSERGGFAARRPQRRQQLLGITKSESVEVPEIPKCDFHPNAPAYADARLPSVGSWANVCKDCFHAHGASLGEGRGQVYIPEGRSKPQKSKGPACPRCAAGDFTRAKREDGLRHTATMKTPSVDTVMKWDFNDSHKATDGCKVEGDGLCRHGHQSWIRRMGIL